ncbi:DNA excision repair protein ERCC-6-like isoform X1 [Montipora capricornis]|uniref:DNA excision repair protein ERCC-6-like isoform X1 n=1 Tax=Montipora capricornis TaxID=246305 RepID=UPI0035F1296F
MEEAIKASQEKETKNLDDKEEQSVGHKTRSYGISIDSGLIPSVPVEKQVSVLRNLGVNVFNQEEFEEGVLKQVDQAIAVKETEEIVKGWEKNLKVVDEDIKTVEIELEEVEKLLGNLKRKSGTGYEVWRRSQVVQKQKDIKLRQLKKLQATQRSLHHKLGLGQEDVHDSQLQEEIQTADDARHDKNLHKFPPEKGKEQSVRDMLVKTGEMTPFGGIVENVQGIRDLEATTKEFDSQSLGLEMMATESCGYDHLITEKEENQKLLVRSLGGGVNSDADDDDDEYLPNEGELKYSWYEDDFDEMESGARAKIRRGKKSTAMSKQSLNVAYREDDALTPKKKKKTIKKARKKIDTKPLDDGSEKTYRQRIREVRIKELLKKRTESLTDDTDVEELPDMEFDKGLKVPGKIWHKLYKYQQTGVQWLWELHCQQAGGIIGDEMGLGKTIQMIAFLAGLKYSKISAKKSKRGGLGPVLIVCPVTVLHQWVQEFHIWWPDFRVAVLHETGTYQGFKQELIKKICDENGVLVTSYSGMRQHQDNLLSQRFDYVILDEGHKIRNPDAEITLACKQLRTPHRIILSGSPMQNNLRELWSLLDFVFPGKLGTLPVFMTEFSVPITMGGYSNATKVQVETAYKCACVLRDTINPYLLRRLKKDVKMSLDLPTKNEQVLFCRLTEEQRELYQQYLDSKEVQAILAGNYKVFPGLIMLRKICNHPDLTSEAGSLWKAKQDELKSEQGEMGEAQEPDPEEGYGDWRRSGKMIVIHALFNMWREQGHRVLVFSQTRQMLNILEPFVASNGYTYLRMDGSTPVASRQPLIKSFNEDNSIFMFLLTTRVGGLGVNLVGADRVVIYDPDWNPSTDTQARERAWRIGQTKPVTIYRLITTGTIEEKIYHRQIFKQFLTNRVLKDPKQRRFFKSNDLYELFTLDNCDKRCGTETSAIFAGSNCEVKVPGSHRRKKQKKIEDDKNSKAVEKVKLGEKALNKIPPNAAEDTGGSFCIDWRDIEETRNFKYDNDENQTEFSSNVCEGQEEGETSLKKVLNEGEKSEKNVLVNKVSDEYFALDSKINDDCSTVQEGKTFLVSQGVKLAPVKETAPATEVKTEEQTERVKRVVFSSDKAAVQGSSGRETSRKGKRKISSLSDEELKKRVRLKEQKKKKKKKRRAKIDGREIENLVYQEMYNPTNASHSSVEDIEEQKQHSARQDEFILKHLFRKTGVHSALKHDVIMESSNPDLALVEGEANRVAQSAVEALKRSRQRCLGAASGVLTWTGLSGSSGLSEPQPKRPRFGKKKKPVINEVPKTSSSSDSKPHFSGDQVGMSSTTAGESEPVHSSHLLAKMRARNNLVPNSDSGADGTANESDSLLMEMRNFIASQCAVIGQATTQEILGEFGFKLPRSDSVVFRSMLRQICTFTRDSLTGKGIWMLKEEFR